MDNNSTPSVAASQAGENTVPGGGRRAKSGDTKNVVYGKPEKSPEHPQGERGDRCHTADEGSRASGSNLGILKGAPPTAQNPLVATGKEQQEQITPEERREKFRKLISTEYKDLYAEEFQEAFNRRFKGHKAMTERLQTQQPVIEALCARYGIADGDMAKLKNALEREAAGGAEKAPQAPDAAALKAARTGQAAMGQLARWAGEGETMKTDYPDFDLAREAKNPRFLAMLRSGVPVRHAYEVLHLGDIVQGVARVTEKRVVDGIRARGARPPENGMSSGSGIIVKSDVSRLTRADRAEIAKRALQGEKISF
ncbi:MAG TPA: hypothetical protein VN369_04695 [Terriglobales bacterium]|nr:hypothetical protein [Terriglobales bacterium]